MGDNYAGVGYFEKGQFRVLSYLGLFLGERGKNAGKDLNGNKCFTGIDRVRVG